MLHETPGQKSDFYSTGALLCDDCYQSGIQDGSVTPPTQEQLNAVAAYRRFSEEIYCAGWLIDPPAHRDTFIKFLKGELYNDETGKDQLLHFEEEHIELLTECLREARPG